ncbi:hypothetical protein [Streptomyces sp. NPDC047869]|uniref:hypothetical protein n=1 Tax=Streptomyces sp. NPDC047869 TaxID=3154709 RepID=UPI003454812F
MRPTRAQSGTGETNQRTAVAETATLSARRGRHRKPRPRKVLFAAGGLALAAGVLSLVRAAPESGVGVPDTALAEPRPDPSGGVTARSTDPAAGIGTARTTRPSATSAMGGVSAAPTAMTAPAETDEAAPGPSATRVPPPGGTGAPTTAPRRTDPATTAPRSSPTPPAPTRTAHEPAPTPSRGTTAPPTWDDGLCLPVIGLCVDVLGGGQD